MPAERYFIPSKLAVNQEICLEGQELHHFVNVMRTTVGEKVELVNGMGMLAVAVVDRIEKKRACLIIEEVHFEQRPTFEVILAQATPRMNRLDFILEKGTELGMTQLWLFRAQHSERKEITEQQLERMRAVTISAMKQCGRLYLPEIVIKPILSKWQALEYPAFFGDVDPSALVLDKAWDAKKDKDRGVIFFVGPESGFTTEEDAKLRQLNAQGVKLHGNILRTETAALAALSIIAHRLL